MTLSAAAPRRATPVAPARPVAGATRADSAWSRLRRDRAAIVALAWLVVVAAVATLAPVLPLLDPNEHWDIVALKNRPPSARFWFGTDSYSRDVFSRVLFGARVSLGVGVLAALLSTTLGAAYGAVAGFVGGRTERAMMRLVDALLGIPRVLVLLAVVALWTAVSTPALIVLLGATGWLGTSRLARDHVRLVRTRDFVTAARALGAPERRILLRHVVPHLATPLMVVTPLAVGHVIALEAGLSYLGLGVQPPHASWGNIMMDGAQSLGSAWWTVAFPGLFVILTVMAVNVLGDGLRDALDPRR
jgi:peptide/nickel transport system permease protein